MGSNMTAREEGNKFLDDYRKHLSTGRELLQARKPNKHIPCTKNGGYSKQTLNQYPENIFKTNLITLIIPTKF